MDKAHSSVLRPKVFNTFTSDLGVSIPEEVKGHRQDGQAQCLDSNLAQRHSSPSSQALLHPSAKGIIRMARRNARERNRVKQVNQGFLTLRHHLPEPFRMKRMSKVDTLRSALGYILSLEKVLVEGMTEAEMEEANEGKLKIKDEVPFFVEDSKESKEN